MTITFSATGIPSTNNNRLEKIKIPTFDGEAHKWASFKNLFETMVHNTNLPEAAKYTHICSALGPRPLGAIQGIHMGVGAYAGAWQTLLDIYDDPRVIQERENFV